MARAVDTRIGAMREYLTITSAASAAIVVTSLTRLNTVATVITSTPHGYVSNDRVTIAGATPSGYNGTYPVTVVNATQFTYIVSNGTLTTPATGTITATYYSDAQGGRKITFGSVAQIFAEEVPLTAVERVQIHAIESHVAYRFRTWSRQDITSAMRVSWIPSWWRDRTTSKNLDITAVLPDGDGRFFMFLECEEVTP